MEEVTGKMQQNATQSAIEEKSDIGDLNEIHSGQTEPDVVTDGGVNGDASPPDSGSDSKQTAPLVVEKEEEDVHEGIQESIFAEDDAISPDSGEVDSDGHGGAGLSIDLNAEINSLLSDDEIEAAAIEIIYGDGEDEKVEPGRKRSTHGGDACGDGDGEPSQQQPNNNLRLFGFNVNAAAPGGGGSPEIQPSEIGLRLEEEDEEGDDASSGGGAAANDGGESPIQQPRVGFRLFGHDI